MTALTVRDGPSLRTPLVWSAALHLIVAAALVFSRTDVHAPTPPTYRVTLIAAPAAPRQIGVVRETPPEPAPTPTPPTPTPISRATPEPERMKAPTKAKPIRVPKVATPNAGAAKAKAEPAPRAGGGPTPSAPC